MYDNLMRKLAEFESTEMPVLSIYLDMRPQATGENPSVRSGEIVLKDRLNQLEKLYRPRGEDLDSFLADKAKIEQFIESHVDKGAKGLAIFACAASGLWEVVEAGVAFENEVVAAEQPDLYQFASLLDKHEKAVAVLVDTSTARFFVTNYGSLDEVERLDDKNAKMFRKRAMGGNKQKKYQRNIVNNQRDFAKEAAQTIENLMESENAKKLIVAGDDVAVPLLLAELSQKTKEIVSDNVLRLDIKTPKDKIAEEVLCLVEEYESNLSHMNADKAISEFKRDGLGVMGIEATKQALENGQVDMLLLDPLHDSITEETSNELLRQASVTSADVEMVSDHDRFHSLGGVGAILRFKL